MAAHTLGWRIGLGAALVAVAVAAHAGRSCEEQPLTVSTLQRALGLAEQARNALERSYEEQGTQVVVLARAGQDLTRHGLQWSHLGFAYRDASVGPGAWRVLHKLNACGTAQASVYRQGLGEFFLDDLWRFEAAWVVPDPALQAQLLPVLLDNTAVTRMHTLAYSMVSYPWSTRYQQSNQWALETLAQSQLPAGAERAQAQAWLFSQNYQPTTLKLGPLTRLGGRMTRANVAFDDHPDAKRFSDRIETVTVDSVFNWLQSTGRAGKTTRIAQP